MHRQIGGLEIDETGLATDGFLDRLPRRGPLATAVPGRFPVPPTDAADD